MPAQIQAAWSRLRAEALASAAREPILAPFLETAVLCRDGFAGALAHYLAGKLANSELGPADLSDLVQAVFAADPSIVAAAVADIEAARDRNPAYRDSLTPFLYFKGYQSLQWYRVGHWLWQAGRVELATWVQSRVSEVFAVDIHPAAQLGRGIFIDHSTGVVIGETAVVGDDVSILQGVTLGGTGKEHGDRHPKIRSGVLIGVGAKILGNIVVGEGAKIGAGSVVLKEVPPHTTVAGVPARVVGRTQTARPALSMDQELPESEG